MVYNIIGIGIIYDFLTLTFDGSDHRLKSFDDHANIDQWVPSNIDLPKVISNGICGCDLKLM